MKLKPCPICKRPYVYIMVAACSRCIKEKRRNTVIQQQYRF